MASLKYFIPPGTSEILYAQFNYSQAVRIPGTPLVKCSGQGGWDSKELELDKDDIEGQVEKAFKNVELVLQNAGLKGWENVYLVRTYHVGIDRGLSVVSDAYRRWCPKHAPTWTAIGVERLGDPRMLIEVEVEAYDDAAK